MTGFDAGHATTVVYISSLYRKNKLILCTTLKNFSGI